MEKEKRNRLYDLINGNLVSKFSKSNWTNRIKWWNLFKYIRWKYGIASNKKILIWPKKLAVNRSTQLHIIRSLRFRNKHFKNSSKRKWKEKRDQRENKTFSESIKRRNRQITVARSNI